VPRRNAPKRSARHSGERGIRKLRKGEKRCSSCLAITGPGGRPKHQTGCNNRGGV
jgi:hypothetical protein